MCGFFFKVPHLYSHTYILTRVIKKNHKILKFFGCSVLLVVGVVTKYQPLRVFVIFLCCNITLANLNNVIIETQVPTFQDIFLTSGIC